MNPTNVESDEDARTLERAAEIMEREQADLEGIADLRRWARNLRAESRTAEIARGIDAVAKTLRAAQPAPTVKSDALTDAPISLTPATIAAICEAVERSVERALHFSESEAARRFVQCRTEVSMFELAALREVAALARSDVEAEIADDPTIRDGEGSIAIIAAALARLDEAAKR